jgi:hypothetical protein
LEWGLATFLECLTTGNDRSTPESGRRVRRPASLLWANTGRQYESNFVAVAREDSIKPDKAYQMNEEYFPTSRKIVLLTDDSQICAKLRLCAGAAPRRDTHRRLRRRRDCR